MLKILFVYSSLTVERVGDDYYCNVLPTLTNRYKRMGRLTVCVSVNDVDKSSMPLVPSDVRIVEVVKENSLRKLLVDRKYNRQKIDNLINEVDLVMAHVPDGIGTYAAKKCRKAGKPFLSIVVGCPWDSLWNYNWKGKLLAPLSYFEMRRMVWHSDYALYVTREFLQHRYPCRGKTTSASNVFITEQPSEVCEKRMARLNGLTKNDEIKLVTTAAIDVPYKGQQYVIEAISKLNQHGWNYHYYLIGGGGTAYIENIIKNCNAENFVHILGPVNHDLLIYKLSDMDIYIQPSKQEGLPRSLVEAMNLGMPALGSRIAGIPELLPRECMFHKGCVKEIVKLLDVEPPSWSKYVEINFTKAKEYTAEILNERRNALFDTIVKDITDKK